MFMMAVMWLPVIGLIIWAVVAATRRNDGSAQSADSALEILKRRYARNEISKDEFEAKKRDLV